MPTNMSMMAILSMALVSMILVTSQSPSAYAGSCPDFGEDNDGDGYCTTTGDCDDTDPEINPEHGCFPLEDLENLIHNVEDLIEDGDLDINKGQTNSVLTKLQNAMNKVDSGNIQAAIGALQAFINQINAFINSGSISQDDGDSLIEEVEDIIGTVS